MFEFAQDLYDLMGRNTNHITAEQFFDKYIASDQAFMVSDEGDKQYIYLDNFTITIHRV